mgnify:CR=1 FL=1
MPKHKFAVGQEVTFGPRICDGYPGTLAKILSQVSAKKWRGTEPEYVIVYGRQGEAGDIKKRVTEDQLSRDYWEKNIKGSYTDHQLVKMGHYGCFLTSACVVAMGLPDNCFELMTLRRFRDTYVANLCGGRGEIAEYYKKAPLLVKAISVRGNDPKETYRQIYNTIVAPCVRLVSGGLFAEAYALYKQKFLELQTRFL